MFGKRTDGRQVHEVEPFQRIVPYIMRTRTDSMNMFEESIPCAGMDNYVNMRRAQGEQITYLHVMIAALVRLVALRPQLNRFVMRGRILHAAEDLGQLRRAPEPAQRRGRHDDQALL